MFLFIKPGCHGPDLSLPEPDVIIESSSDFESSDKIDTAECGAYRPGEDDQRRPLTQAEFNDLT